MGLGCRAGAGGNLNLLAHEIHLVFVDLARLPMEETGIDYFFLVGDQGCQPVFVGNADPAAGGCSVYLARFHDIAVIDFLQGALEYANRAFMKDIEACCLGRAGPVDERVRGQCHRFGAQVLHPLGDGEHEVLIHRYGAYETQALTVIPGQPHRYAFGEALPRCLPQGIGIGHFDGLIAGDPAMFGVIGLGRPTWCQKPDERALGVNGLAEVFEGHIVDLAALKGDGTGKLGGVQGYPGAPDHGPRGRYCRASRRHGLGRGCARCGARGGARGGRAPGIRCLLWPWDGARGRRCRRCRLRRLGRGAGGAGGLGGLKLARPLGFHLRLLPNELEGEHDQDRGHDGDDQVFLVAHGNSR